MQNNHFFEYESTYRNIDNPGKTTLDILTPRGIYHKETSSFHAHQTIEQFTATNLSSVLTSVAHRYINYRNKKGKHHDLANNIIKEIEIIGEKQNLSEKEKSLAMITKTKELLQTLVDNNSNSELLADYKFVLENAKPLEKNKKFGVDLWRRINIFWNRLSGNTPAEINSQKLEELINKEHGDTTPQPPVNPEPTEGSAPAPKI